MNIYSYRNLLVRSVDIFNGNDGQISVISRISESDSGTGLDAQLLNSLFRYIEVYGHAEEVTICKTGFSDHADGWSTSRLGQEL